MGVTRVFKIVTRVLKGCYKLGLSCAKLRIVELEIEVEWKLE